MTNRPTSTPGSRPLPGNTQKGYQPSAPAKPQGGHQPATGQGAPSNPPNQGSGGKK